jgi:hypothetical protein
MTMKTKTKVDRSDQADQRDLAVVSAEVRALLAMITEVALDLATLGRAEAALPVDTFLKKASPDELLDRWQAARGDKAEAHLLGRIYRRRASRRAAL